MVNKLNIPGAVNLGYVITHPSGPTPWLVENWIIEGEMAVIHGAANVGKSYVALDLGLHIAMGEKEWARNQIPVQRPVIYIPSEGHRGAERRMRTWMRSHRPEILAGLKPEDFEETTLVWEEYDSEGEVEVIEVDADRPLLQPERESHVKLELDPT